jgi:hypothetical protein
MRIPEGKTYQGLASWVSYIRKRKPELHPSRLRELKRLGFVWDPYENAWLRGLEELRKFVKDQGHANVPARSSEYPLAAGLVLLGRKLYRTGKLDPDKRTELESIGMIWNPMNSRWEEHYRELCDVHRRLGHIQMPIKPEYKTLKRWLRRQKGRRRLLPEQKRRLEALDASILVKRYPGWHGVYHGTRSRTQKP